MSRRTRKNVGVIGLGIIGSRIREVLRRKGFHVFVWNRTPRTVPNFVGAPAELAEMCNYLQIFVSDDDALLYVAKQLSPGLGARHVVLAHSTVAPNSMRAAAEIIERRGARFVEAPFTGSKEAAEKGELVYYVGGEEDAISDARPILEATGKHVMEIGAIGQATAIKLATNMVTAASVQAAAEALALVEASDVPLEKFAAAMKGNASNSATLAMKLPKMMGGDFEPHFSVKHMLKDLQIASRLGLSNHLELGVSSAARDRLLEQMQQGHGDQDYSAVIRKYFPDIQPPPPETDLELFEAAEPELEAPDNEFAPTNGHSENGGELFPELEGPSVSGHSLQSSLSLGPLPAHTKSKSDRGEEHDRDVLLESHSDVMVEESEELGEEDDSPRGFLGRLLRRVGNY